MTWARLFAIVGALLGVLLVMFLGGLSSAWFEVRREVKAGQIPTRPAWDKRDYIAASGGRWAYVRGLYRGLRGWRAAAPSYATPCPACGRDGFTDDSGYFRCPDYDLGDPEAIQDHMGWSAA
jgi:hypothetical protein